MSDEDPDTPEYDRFRDYLTDWRTLHGILLGFMTGHAVIDPTLQTIGLALTFYTIAYIAAMDPGPYESVRNIPRREIPHIVTGAVGLGLWGASILGVTLSGL